MVSQWRYSITLVEPFQEQLIPWGVELLNTPMLQVVSVVADQCFKLFSIKSSCSDLVVIWLPVHNRHSSNSRRLQWFIGRGSSISNWDQATVDPNVSSNNSVFFFDLQTPVGLSTYLQALVDRTQSSWLSQLGSVLSRLTLPIVISSMRLLLLQLHRIFTALKYAFQYFNCSSMVDSDSTFSLWKAHPMASRPNHLRVGLKARSRLFWEHIL